METTETPKQKEAPRIEYLIAEGESTALDEVFDLLFARLDSSEE